MYDILHDINRDHDIFWYVLVFIIFYIILLITLKKIGLWKKLESDRYSNCCPVCKYPLERIRRLTSDHVINYNEDKDWWKKVQKFTYRKGVDIVVEVGGSKTLEQSIKCSKVGAVIGIIGVLSGGIAELPIGRVIYKASRLIGFATTSDSKDLSPILLQKGDECAQFIYP